METQALESPNTNPDSSIDNSRPFRSVKEAIAIFGQRLLTPPKFSFEKEASHSSLPSQSPNKSLVLDKQTTYSSVIIQSPDKPPNTSPKLSRFALERQISDSSLSTQSPHIFQNNSGKQGVASLVINEPKPSPRSPENESHGNVVHGNDLVMMLMVLKKLESDLQETKMELKLLKERESETEIALASLNAELHKNMSKIAKAEAVVAAAATAKSIMGSSQGGKREMREREGEKERGDMMVKNLDSPTLAQILSISDYESYFGRSKKVNNKLMKKKPIIPLVTDIFLWKKRPSPTNDLLSPLFSSHMYSV